MNEGLKYAHCALSFYGHRHSRVPRFANATRKRNVSKTVSRFRENVRMARHYIKLARRAGWRGSILREVNQQGGNDEVPKMRS